MATKYQWLTAQLRTLIASNLREGIEKIPSENELCKQYKVSRQTVRLALSILTQEGLLYKKQGSGSFLTGLCGNSCQNVIGILIPNDQEYTYPALLYDLKSALTQAGYSVTVFCTDNQVDREYEILQSLLLHPLRGLLVDACKSALPNPNIACYQALLRQGTQVLFLNNFYSLLPECPVIKSDNLSGSALLVQQLVKQGHQKIGGIFKRDDIEGLERYLGLQTSMRSCQLPISDDCIVWYDTHALSLLEKKHDTGFLKQSIRQSFSECSAVVCQNDEIAYWLLQELKAAHYQVPADIALASFDHSYLFDFETLPILSVAHKSHQLANTAAHMMVEKLKGLPVFTQEIPWKLFY